MKYQKLYTLITEKWLDTIKYGGNEVEVFVNPNPRDLMDCAVRAIVDKKGDLYTVYRFGKGESSIDILHTDVLEMLHKYDQSKFKNSELDGFYGFEDEPIVGVAVVRRPKEKEFYLSESVFFKIKPSEQAIEKIHNFIKQAQEKTHYKFHMETINGVKFNK